MVGTGALSIGMIGQIADGGNVIDVLLSNGTTGLIIFWILIAVLLVAMYVAVFQIMRDKD